MDKLTQNWNWKPPENWLSVKTIDLHTEGEPLRVIIGGLPPVPGSSILDKIRYFREHLDHIRKGLMFEPRGHADMYGAIITEPISEDADFGTFFLHNEGYSTMCGHAIIALTKLVFDTGIIKKEGNNPELIIDAPPGKIYANAHRGPKGVERSAFRNVPSFVLLADQYVDIDGLGRVKFDVAYGGAFYAICDAGQIDLSLDSSDYNRLIDYGKKIKHAVMTNYQIEHPFEKELSFLYGTIFTGKPINPENHSRNVCIFAEGEVDRSPTGSGVSARAALHATKGELGTGQKVVIESILGTTMSVEIIETCSFGPHKAVIPEVSGTAFITGQNEFYFDPDDPLKQGFIFR